MEKAQQIDNSAKHKILNGNIPKMMLGIILPLFAYAMLDKLYTFFEMFDIIIVKNYERMVFDESVQKTGKHRCRGNRSYLVFGILHFGSGSADR